MKGELDPNVEVMQAASWAMAGVVHDDKKARLGQELTSLFLKSENKDLQFVYVLLIVVVGKQHLNPSAELTERMVQFFMEVPDGWRYQVLSYFAEFQIQHPEIISALMRFMEQDTEAWRLNAFRLLAIMNYQELKFLNAVESDYQKYSPGPSKDACLWALLKAKYKEKIYQKVLVDRFDQADKVEKLNLFDRYMPMWGFSDRVAREVFEMTKLGYEQMYYSMPMKLFAAQLLLAAKLPNYLNDARAVVFKVAEEAPNKIFRQMARFYIRLLELEDAII